MYREIRLLHPEYQIIAGKVGDQRMIPAMTRLHREGYNAVIDAAKATMQAVRTYKKKLPDGDYSGLEATAEFLFNILDVHEKCRIVIEYDPAEERTAIYRTEFEGKPITFDEYRHDLNEKSDCTHVER